MGIDTIVTIFILHNDKKSLTNKYEVGKSE